jgi:hypothetical protein
LSASVVTPGAAWEGAAWEGVVPRADVRFIADLAAKIRWDARTGADPAAAARTRMIREQIATGTLDALCWMLDVTDQCPSSGRVRPERTASVVEFEAKLAESLRRSCPEDSSEALYLGGVADGLDFVLGDRKKFWWVPLPEALRPGRDEYGRGLTGA